MIARRVLGALLWIACGALAACGDDAPASSNEAVGEASSATDVAPTERLPLSARWDLVDELRMEASLRRHPADGGGVLRAVGELPDAIAGERARYSLEFEVGEHGIAEGGTLEWMAPPFWFWSSPYILDDAQASSVPGRLRVELPEGVELELLTPLGAERCVARLAGRALRSGERLGLSFGDEGVGVEVDRYAERTPVLLMRVDGDGDGVSGLVADPPLANILPGDPAQIVATLTSSLQPGQLGALHVAALDAFGNACRDAPLSLRLSGSLEVLGLPDSLELPATGLASRRVAFTPAADGVARVLVEASDTLFSLSNPLVVAAGAEPVLWADLHGHSRFSDGTGEPADFYRYAREVAALDVAALTDHDHWGTPFLDREPQRVELLRETARAAHAPGEFVALFGYEWTSWIHGHRHVLAFAEPEVLPWLSSLDEATEHPEQLWSALRGLPVRTFAHHTAGEPVLTNWEIKPDPVLEPVVEVSSVHGSSEAADGLPTVAGAQAGFFVRDALDSGNQLGFVGSGDSHDGHPGLVHLNPISRGRGGLAALIGAEHTRASVREALDARRCFATSGARILLRVALAGQRMGSRLSAPSEPVSLVALVHGTLPLERVDLIRSGAVAGSQTFDADQLDALASFELADLKAGEYVYVRVIQQDGHGAWSSPFFIED